MFDKSLSFFQIILNENKNKTLIDYKVGNHKEGYSEVFHFKSLPSGNDWKPSLAIYGDMGIKNEQSLPLLKEDVKKDLYDAIFHIGDLAYDLGILLLFFFN